MSVQHIFLVDDDTSILESFKIILENEGYLVSAAANGKELTSLLSQTIPDLILLDYSMPLEDGGSLTRKIRANSETAHIPIVIISANSKFRTQSMLAGADDFLEKPLEIQPLLGRIKKILS